MSNDEEEIFLDTTDELEGAAAMLLSMQHISQQHAILGQLTLLICQV